MLGCDASELLRMDESSDALSCKRSAPALCGPPRSGEPLCQVNLARRGKFEVAALMPARTDRSIPGGH